MTINDEVERLLTQGMRDPVEILGALGATRDPTTTDEASYQYERDATDLYGLKMPAGLLSASPSRWEEPARREMVRARDANELPSEFFAFAVLATSLRRGGKLSELARLLDDQQGRFSECPLFEHFRVMAEVAAGHSPQITLEHAEAAARRLGRNAGAFHDLALAHAAMAEISDSAAAERNLKAAAISVSTAIRLKPQVARFRLTRARVYRLQGRLDAARDDVLSARQDDPDAEQDSERRRIYDNELLLVSASAELERRIGEIERRVDSRVAGVETRSAEIAGFLTGVVALTLTGTQLATNPNVTPTSAFLILIVVAVLVFGSALLLGLVLGRRR